MATEHTDRSAWFANRVALDAVSWQDLDTAEGRRDEGEGSEHQLCPWEPFEPELELLPKALLSASGLFQKR
jgi:hypothetical protein